MCTVYFVDEATKQKIAAYSARFREVSASPFGADDQIGMLNLIDPESRAAIVSRADAGKVFDLAVDHFVGMPGWLAANDPVVSDLDDPHPARRGDRRRDGGRRRCQPSHLLLGGCRLDVHPHRHACRFAQSLRLPRPDLQSVLRAGSPRQQALAGVGRRQAPAGDRARAAARRRRPAWPGDAAAELRDRARRPGGLPQASGHRAAPWRRGDGQDRAHARLARPWRVHDRSARPQSRRRRVPGQGRRDHDRRATITASSRRRPPIPRTGRWCTPICSRRRAFR